MGRMPMIAAPTAAPKKPSSEIGVSRMRSGKRCSRPNVTVNAPPKPPGTPISSPRQNTDGSRSISSAMPSRSASAIDCRFIGLIQFIRKYVTRQVVGCRLRRLACRLDTHLDSLGNMAFDSAQFGFANVLALEQQAPQQANRVTLEPVVLLVFGLVVAWIAARVACS